jgi:hypothetical protein
VTIVTPASGFDVVLSEAYVLAHGGTPLVAGDDLEIRFQVRRDGAAVDLTGWTLWWTMRDKEGGTGEFIRRSSTGQIVLDDQTTEDEDAGTGTGWCSVVFVAADRTALLAFVGLLRPWPPRGRAPPPDSTVQSLGRGKCEWLRPRSMTLT